MLSGSKDSRVRVYFCEKFNLLLNFNKFVTMDGDII